jgi:hypothetical protein
VGRELGTISHGDLQAGITKCLSTRALRTNLRQARQVGVGGWTSRRMVDC